MERLIQTNTSHTSGASTPRTPLYESPPQTVIDSQMTAFTRALQNSTGLLFTDHAELHDFTVHEYRTFWRSLVQWSADLKWSGELEPVCEGDDCAQARFFPNMQLNYAQNLLGLACADADAPAIYAHHADGADVRLARGELRERVTALANALLQLGIQAGDRVVGIMRNDEQAVIAALAVSAIGATFSSAAPEMGVDAMLDRFVPLAPRLLFAHLAPRSYDAGTPVAENIATLAAALSSLNGIVSLDEGRLPGTHAAALHSMADLISRHARKPFEWRQFPFNHPLFIMFSSGTTGKPKCIVHSTGGVLLEHIKEHRLHSDLRPGDKLFFHTSCAWMMWNWQLSALASGVEIVTYDGPIATVDTLWQLVANQRVSVFGTSPAYLKMCEDAGLVPARQFDLGALRALFSTGAILFDAQFQWVRARVKPLQICSISGGTDILGCFVLGNPNLPVFPGEAQCKSLGLDVQAWAQGVPAQGVGELICANPFPSRPLGFLGDPDGSRFHAAYFAANPGVWTHGDLVAFTREGGARLYGRSDGVLNVRGINVGPGEIYKVLNDIPEIREAVVVEQRYNHAASGDGQDNWSGQRLVLMLVLQPGVTLSHELASRVRHDLVRRASAAHVPDVIVTVDALPTTHNGKLSEAAVRNAVNGLPVGNLGALRNPDSLNAIGNHPALSLARRELPPPGNSLEQLEQYLQALWENLFAFTPIRRDDNFFELGGHSLLAARLLAQLTQSTGRKLPLATLLTAPTISQLAQVLHDDTPVQSPSTLVLMRAGTGTPLFLAHSVTGSVMECWALVGALHTTRPVYGIQALGLDGEQIMQSRVEDMAASYIAQMRKVQASGPYALCGYSFGGLVAFEIAQQLMRAGEKIESLCLLDTYVQARYLPWLAWARHQWAYVGEQVRNLRALSLSQRIVYVRHKIGAAQDRIRLRLGRTALRPETDAAALPPMLRHVRERLRVAMVGYRPRPYDAGPILYVRAAEPMQGNGDPLLLWNRVARGGLVVVEVPGGHSDIMFAPNVQHVAAALDRAASLDRMSAPVAGMAA